MSDRERRTDLSRNEAKPDPAGEDAAHPLSGARSGTPWRTVSARVISFVSRKGGVGKTTSAVNLGAAFALSGHSVLLVGMDPQCGVSHSFGHGKYDLDSGLLDVFHSQLPLNHLAYPTAVENLHFVTPNVWTLEEEEEYRRCLTEETDTFLRAMDRARNLYDTILLDCPPGFGPEVRAALLASDSYLVPVQAEELCRESLGRLFAFIQAFRDQAYAESNVTELDGDGSPLRLEGLFLTMTNSRTRLSRHVADRVAEEYGLDLLGPAVPRTTRLAEMALRAKPAVIYDRRSAGSRAYFDLMDEIVARYDARQTEAAAAAPARPATKPGNGGARPETAAAMGVGKLAPGLRLAELGATLSAALEAAEPAWATAAEEPELVSLDDLIEEEERADDESDGDWEASDWSADADWRGRSH